MMSDPTAYKLHVSTRAEGAMISASRPQNDKLVEPARVMRMVDAFDSTR